MALTFTLGLNQATADSKPKTDAKPNRLAKESSPYLLQHGHNPVDWYPWGAEAFERAKKEKKFIFLSIGYSSCHWCHVMERESFSNDEIAKVLNENFVCIKVDREERPDVDDIYMTALNVVGQNGGWPLTMFLTSDGKPIFGGTYFPPDDKKVDEGTITGMKSILKRVIELEKKDRAGLETQAAKIAEMTAEALQKSHRAVPLTPLDREIVTDASAWFEIDPEHGGIGDKLRNFRGTKFPRVAALSFLHRQSQKPKQDTRAKLVALTLRKMAEGGIYDQLGGGFHRYSTERTWTVPHFEKMLYDNAQLVELYSEAYRTTPDPLYRRVVAETLAFVKREMTDPSGGFYSALDADSNGVEGEFYFWTTEELRQVLANEADVKFITTMYATEKPNFEEKFHILRLPKSNGELAKQLKLTETELHARLEPLKAKLLAHRAKRVRPFLDTKVIVAWNGQMIAGYARAGEVFRDKSFTAEAVKAAEFLLQQMRDKNRRLLRMYAAAPGEKPTARGPAFLEDYAFLLHGFLALHDATNDKRWLDEAKALADTAIQWHADQDRGGFFFTAHDHEKLFARAKDSYDGAQPSGNGMMAVNLLKLWQKTNELKYRDICFRTIRSYAQVLKSNPGSVPTLVGCLDMLLDVAAKDPTAMQPKDAPAAAGSKMPRETKDVVQAKLELSKPDKNGEQSFTITLTIAEPWHIYANPVGNDAVKESETILEIYLGEKKIEDSVEFPKGELTKDTVTGDYQTYTGEVKITGSMKRGKEDGPHEFRLRMIACRERTCLLPSVIKLK